MGGLTLTDWEMLFLIQSGYRPTFVEQAFLGRMSPSMVASALSDLYNKLHIPKDRNRYVVLCLYLQCELFVTGLHDVFGKPPQPELQLMGAFNDYEVA